MEPCFNTDCLLFVLWDYLYFTVMLTFCLSPFLFTVQSHKVCWEPAGDDQLSHGMLSLPCETGCIVPLLSFLPPFTAGWWRNSAGTTVWNSSLTVRVFIYCWEGLQQTIRQRKWVCERTATGWRRGTRTWTRTYFRGLAIKFGCLWARHLIFNCTHGAI